ncbi:MAG: helix-turn-helix domain-containing protein [Gemmatimonadetes bacterium]|nr:helix-turn-helix domain-containing protein [Gemmatimonadota bacterium]
MSDGHSVVTSHREFGEQLRVARRARRLTQAQAAVLAGVGVRLWNEAENGRRSQVGLETMLRMMRAVGIEVRLVPQPAMPAEPDRRETVAAPL